MRPKTLLILSAVAIVFTGTVHLTRRGYIFPELGSTLNFLFHPDDMWRPLAETAVRADVHDYVLSVVHRFPGNHAVQISVPSRRIGGIPVDGLTFHVEATGYPAIRAHGPKELCPFLGRERDGVIVCWYRFPRDIMTRDPVQFRVRIDGNLEPLVQQFGDVRISVVKESDE